jgi:hypothetical protein
LPHALRHDSQHPDVLQPIKSGLIDLPPTPTPSPPTPSLTTRGLALIIAPPSAFASPHSGSGTHLRHLLKPPPLQVRLGVTTVSDHVWVWVLCVCACACVCVRMCACVSVFAPLCWCP